MKSSRSSAADLASGTTAGIGVALDVELATVFSVGAGSLFPVSSSSQLSNESSDDVRLDFGACVVSATKGLEPAPFTPATVVVSRGDSAVETVESDAGASAFILDGAR